MKWVSTRGASPPVPFIDALFAGTAPDGGLYMPERLDPLPAGTLERLARRRHRRRSAPASARTCCATRSPPAALTPLVADALDFPVPLVQVTDRVWALELFHGPTLAFKDVGARVQARLLHHFTDGTPLTILVATSGDTGSAVAQAFHRVPDTRVVVLYPEGQVSDVQEAQMASLGDNITALAVRGTFDDCQRLVKQAFADDELRAHVWLTPANSINLGRLLPQVFYYFLLAAAAPATARPDRVGAERQLRQPDGRADRQADRPAGSPSSWPPPTSTTPCPCICGRATTSRAPSVRTVANAMDVGAPSNFERMQALYGGDLDALRRDVAGVRLRRRAGGRGDRRRLPAARLPARSARRDRAGWRCRTRSTPDPDAHGRLPGHRAPGEVPRGRRAGDRPAGAAAAARWPRR